MTGDLHAAYLGLVSSTPLTASQTKPFIVQSQGGRECEKLYNVLDLSDLVDVSPLSPSLDNIYNKSRKLRGNRRMLEKKTDNFLLE